jgi:membrane-associated phospholipid phosphatase
MILALDPTYARDLVKLLKDGPGLISPVEAKGLIGFPSYHAVLALLVMWHARGLKHLRIPAILLNIVVLLATPIQGGHHLVDVLGAIPVAAFALFIVETSQRTETAMKPSIVVNKLRKFTIRPVPQGLFRITAEQDDEAKPAPIKPKLSGFP